MGLVQSSGFETSTPIVPERWFVTDDPAEILAFAFDGFDRLGSSALVTLVSVKGGAARPVGAQMAVHGDGAFCGFVSGGCTEAAVAAEALAAIEAGKDRFLHLGEGSKFFDIVLPCGGAITLYIHVLKDCHAVDVALSLLSDRQSVSLCIDTDSQTISVSDVEVHTGWSDGSFIRSYAPKTRLVVCGRGIDAEVTARLGAASGFETVKFDGPDSFDGRCVDAHTAVVILLHDLDAELPILRAALNANPYYIGALGSTRTHAKRRAALRHLGYQDDVADRIHAPIGLVKAKDSQTLGLSILTEVAAVHADVFA